MCHILDLCDSDHADVFVKVDSWYGNYTVEEIKGFCNKLSDVLQVSSQGVLRLCQVEKGCFQLTLQVPSFVQQKVFPLSRGQERTLESEGVITLTCGEYHYPDNDCADWKPQLNGQVCLDDPLAVEVEGFKPVQEKPQLDTDTGVSLICKILATIAYHSYSLYSK